MGYDWWMYFLGRQWQKCECEWVWKIWVFHSAWSLVHIWHVWWFVSFFYYHYFFIGIWYKYQSMCRLDFCLFLCVWVCACNHKCTKLIFVCKHTHTHTHTHIHSITFFQITVNLSWVLFIGKSLQTFNNSFLQSTNTQVRRKLEQCGLTNFCTTLTTPTSHAHI